MASFFSIVLGVLALGVATLAVQLIVLLRRRARSVNYNRFVHAFYTRRGEATPPLIERIQSDYITAFNGYRGRRVLIRHLFKPLPEIDRNVQPEGLKISPKRVKIE